MRSVAELWLEKPQDVASRTAPPPKGALNAVSINLEAIRTVGPRPNGAGGDATPRFTAAAAQKIAVVIRMSEGVRALDRAPPPGSDAVVAGGATEVHRFQALLEPAIRERGSSFSLVAGRERPTATAADRRAVRLAIGAALCAAAAGNESVECSVEDGAEGG